MRTSRHENVMVETVARGVRVMRFARPDVLQYLDEAADAATSPLFHEVHEAALANLPERWTLVVNLAIIDRINAAFYRCLLDIRKCVNVRHAKLVLCGLTPHHREVFELFRGPDVFSVVRTEARARTTARQEWAALQSQALLLAKRSEQAAGDDSSDPAYEVCRF
jgi:anti-anti-sigma regulatory factor